MAERRKLSNAEVLVFILGFDPKKKEVTIQQIARQLNTTPEFIVDCDINQFFELCRKAQQIRGLNIEKEIKEKYEVREKLSCDHPIEGWCSLCF